MSRLKFEFFNRDVLEVAPDLVGKVICRNYDNDAVERFIITETEAYRGEEDMASHARFGKTPRTEVLYGKAGHLYVYLIYGMYYMLNIVAGNENEPQGTLIRSVKGTNGPGRLTKVLEIDKSFYGESLTSGNRIWIEEGLRPSKIITSKRIGIEYAGDWAEKPWRFFINV